MLPDGTPVSGAPQLGKEIAELLFDPKPLGRPDLPEDGFRLVELAPGIDLSDVTNNTDADIVVDAAAEL